MQVVKETAEAANLWKEVADAASFCGRWLCCGPHRSWPRAPALACCGMGGFCQQKMCCNCLRSASLTLCSWLQATDTARPHEAAGGHEAPDQAAKNGVRVQASPKLLDVKGPCSLSWTARRASCSAP